MTGLFYRLAQQVVGPELPRVRTATRLPFASPPATEDPGVMAAGEPSSITGRDAAGPAHEPPGGEGEPTRNAGTPPAVPSPLPETSEPARQGAATRDANVPEASVAHVPAEPPRPPARPADDPAAMLETGHMPGARAAQPKAPPRDVPAAGAPRRHPVTPMADPTAAGPVPPPLMPEIASPPAARHAAPGDTARRPEAAETAPPEVHVHIGRIDVASVGEPPPRREPPARRKPALSLEAYLAKRKSGG